MNAQPAAVPAWMPAVLAVDRLARTVRALAGPHHWHPNLPPGPAGRPFWSCCACPRRLKTRLPSHRDGLACTTWTA